MTLDIKSLIIGTVIGMAGVYVQPFIEANRDLVAYGVLGMAAFAIGLVGYCAIKLNRAFSPAAINRDLDSASVSKQNTAQENEK